MTEHFSNLGQTSINQIGGISATATSVTVTALSGSGHTSFHSFPSTGNFRVVLGSDSNSEIVLCTAVNTVTKTFTIIRGQEGTDAQAWSNGTTVTIALTAQAVSQMRADIFSVGKYSDRPAQGLSTGSYYQTTNGHTPWVWDPDAGMWRPQIQGVLGFQPPPKSLFSVSVDSSVDLIDTYAGAIDYTGDVDSPGSTNFRGFAFNFAQPGFIETCVQNIPTIAQTANTLINVGPFFRESSSGYMYSAAHAMLTADSTSIEYLEAATWPDSSTQYSHGKFNCPLGNGPIFIRISWSGSGEGDGYLQTEFSRDRNKWFTIDTQPLNYTFNNGPDQFGFGGFITGSNSVVRLLSFDYGAHFSPIIHMAPPEHLQPTIYNPSMNGWITRVINH